MSRKIVALDQLEAELTEDLKWRSNECEQWESLAQRARQHEICAIVRGGIALVYAHWEGYIKDSARAYLEYVSRQGLSMSQLRPELAAVALRTLLGKGESSKNSIDHTEIVMAIRENASEPARIPYDRAMIRTNSNLSYERFEDIMHSIGCSTTAYEIHRGLVNLRLLKNRNEISHGRDLFVNLEDWLEIRKRVFDILLGVRTQISNAAALKEYRRDSINHYPKSDTAAYTTTA